MTTINYICAFDDDVCEDTITNVSSMSDIASLSDLDEFPITQEMEEDPELDLISDDEDEVYEIEEPPRVVTKAPSLFAQSLTEEKRKEIKEALDGKMVWAETDFSAVIPSLGSREFPPCGWNKNQKKPPTFKNWKREKELKLNVKFVTSNSQLLFQKKPETKICRFFAQGKECQYKDSCTFMHVTPICKWIANGETCRYNNNCRFVHPPVCPKKHCTCEKIHMKPGHTHTSNTSTSQKSQKTRFCSNLIKQGKCDNTACRFSHSIEEVKKNVIKCKSGENGIACPLVKKVKNKEVVQRKTITYTNCYNDGRKCFRIHRGETVENYVARLLPNKS